VSVEKRWGLPSGESLGAHVGRKTSSYLQHVPKKLLSVVPGKGRDVLDFDLSRSPSDFPFHLPASWPQKAPARVAFLEGGGPDAEQTVKRKDKIEDEVPSEVLQRP